MQEATSGNNKYMQIFNPTSASVTLDGYFIGGCSNGCTTPITSASSSDSFEVTFSFPANAIVAAAAVYTLCNSGLTGDTSMCDVSSSHTILSFNGDDFRALCRGSPTSYTIIDQIGLGGADPGSSWPVCGSHSSIDTRNGLLLRATNRCCGLGLLGDAEYASSFVGVCSWATEDAQHTTPYAWAPSRACGGLMASPSPPPPSPAAATCTQLPSQRPLICSCQYLWHDDSELPIGHQMFCEE